MKKINYVKCKKYKKVENSKIFYLFYKTFVNSIICAKFSSKDKRILKQEELKFIGFIENK